MNHNHDDNSVTVQKEYCLAGKVSDGQIGNKFEPQCSPEGVSCHELYSQLAKGEESEPDTCACFKQFVPEGEREATIEQIQCSYIDTNGYKLEPPTYTTYPTVDPVIEPEIEEPDVTIMPVEDDIWYREECRYYTYYYDEEGEKQEKYEVADCEELVNKFAESHEHQMEISPYCYYIDLHEEKNDGVTVLRAEPEQCVIDNYYHNTCTYVHHFANGEFVEEHIDCEKLRSKMEEEGRFAISEECQHFSVFEYEEKDAVVVEPSYCAVDLQKDSCNYIYHNYDAKTGAYT